MKLPHVSSIPPYRLEEEPQTLYKMAPPAGKYDLNKDELLKEIAGAHFGNFTAVLLPR